MSKVQTVWIHYNDAPMRAWDADIVEETGDYLKLTFKRTQYRENTPTHKYGCWPDLELRRKKDNLYSIDKKRTCYIFHSWEEYKTFQLQKIEEEIQAHKKAIGNLKVERVILNLETEQIYPIPHYDRENHPEIMEALKKYKPWYYGKNGSITKMMRNIEKE